MLEDLGVLPQDCSDPVNDIVRENCKKGSPAPEWDINAAGSSSNLCCVLCGTLRASVEESLWYMSAVAPRIQGFATQSSYVIGEQVLFKVKTVSSVSVSLRMTTPRHTRFAVH